MEAGVGVMVQRCSKAAVEEIEVMCVPVLILRSFLMYKKCDTCVLA